MTRAETAASTALQLRLGVAILLFLVLATGPYLWLIANFEYDDILREPAADILAKFHAGGSALVIAWLGFALSALLFIPVAFGFHQFSGSQQPGALFLGTLSALLQAAGLLRWVLVVPALAATFQDPATSSGTRDAVLVVFDAVHRYGGMIGGELLGQVLLAAWTGVVSRQLYLDRSVPRWLALFGALTLPFWVIGQTEVLHGAIPAVPAIEVIPVAFIAWQVWLTLLAVVFLTSPWRSPGKIRALPADDGAAATSEAPAP